jgi:hypothetical protein
LDRRCIRPLFVHGGCLKGHDLDVRLGDRNHVKYVGGVLGNLETLHVRGDGEEQCCAPTSSMWKEKEKIWTNIVSAFKSNIKNPSNDSSFKAN